MSKPIIAIDVDDVLADNAAGFVAFSNAQWGTTLTVEDYDEHWAEVWQVDNAEVERRNETLRQAGVIKTYRHDETALPVLRRLSERYQLMIVTSRRTEIKADTLDWVHQHYPGVFTDETIHFAGIWDTIDDQSVHRTKADVITTLGANYLIDDQLKHCQAVAETGRRALLFGDYGWNKANSLHPNITRVSGWADVERYFEHVD